MLTDSFDRAITYLRISVTDRCNLRCAYCLPRAGVQWKPRKELLSSEEIVQVVRAAADHGVRKIRLTGGEPLVRPDLPELVGAIARLPGIDEVSLTTNGMLLERLAAPLTQAGLARVNVSLDTRDPEKFRRITRLGSIERVWRGIAAAERAGLTPIKLNTVVVRGLNDDELLELARLTLDRSWHVRFIELMPVGNAQDWGADFPAADQRYFSVLEMRAQLATFDLQPADPPKGNGPARTFRIPGARGTVGFISPIGEHFCASCNRLRLTADGRLRPCLLLDTEVPVREALRAGRSPEAALCAAVQAKPERHELARRAAPQLRHMAQIGG